MKLTFYYEYWPTLGVEPTDWARLKKPDANSRNTTVYAITVDLPVKLRDESWHIEHPPVEVEGMGEEVAE